MKEQHDKGKSAPYEFPWMQAERERLMDLWRAQSGRTGNKHHGGFRDLTRVAASSAEGDYVVYLKTDGGDFVLAGGAMYWLEPGTGLQEVGVAGFSALYLLGWSIMAGASAAIAGCGAASCGAALADLGFNLVFQHIEASVSDLTFLGGCIAKGMDQPYYD